MRFSQRTAIDARTTVESCGSHENLSEVLWAMGESFTGTAIMYCKIFCARFGASGAAKHIKHIKFDT